MQLDTGISMSRYFPAIGTAGLLRDLVSGNRRAPRPPPRIRETTRSMEDSFTSGERPSVPVADGLHQSVGLFEPRIIVHQRRSHCEMMALSRVRIVLGREALVRAV